LLSGLRLSDHDNPRFERRTNAAWSFEPYESGIGVLAQRPRTQRITGWFVRGARDRYHLKADSLSIRVMSGTFRSS